MGFLDKVKQFLKVSQILIHIVIQRQSLLKTIMVRFAIKLMESSIILLKRFQIPLTESRLEELRLSRGL